MSTSTTAKQLISHRSSVDPWGRKRDNLAEHAALVEKLNQEARSNWDNESWHRQVAQDIANSLDYGFVFENLFSSYFQVDTVGEFDRVILRERRGLKVFYTSRGGYIDESQLREEMWALPRDTLGFHVSEHIDKLRANFATTMEDMVTLGQLRMEAEVNRRIFSLLQAAAPQGSPSYVATAGLTKPEVDAAVREVRDAIKPTSTGPVPVTIIGRASMVDQISDFTTGFNATFAAQGGGSVAGNFDPSAAEEIRNRGRLGVYRGAQVIQITNYTDEEGVPFIPANELWVFGGSVGQFAMYGPLNVKTWDENTVDYRHYRARKDVGGLVHHPEQARRIVDSTVAP
jgi:hypothetical protein